MGRVEHEKAVERKGRVEGRDSLPLGWRPQAGGGLGQPPAYRCNPVPPTTPARWPDPGRFPQRPTGVGTENFHRNRCPGVAKIGLGQEGEDSTSFRIGAVDETAPHARDGWGRHRVSGLLVPVNSWPEQCR